MGRGAREVRVAMPRGTPATLAGTTETSPRGRATHLAPAGDV